jgi:hypothetical protein
MEETMKKPKPDLGKIVTKGCCRYPDGGGVLCIIQFTGWSLTIWQTGYISINGKVPDDHIGIHAQPRDNATDKFAGPLPYNYIYDKYTRNLTRWQRFKFGLVGLYHYVKD